MKIEAMDTMDFEATSSMERFGAVVKIEAVHTEATGVVEHSGAAEKIEAIDAPDFETTSGMERSRAVVKIEAVDTEASGNVKDVLKSESSACKLEPPSPAKSWSSTSLFSDSTDHENCATANPLTSKSHHVAHGNSYGAKIRLRQSASIQHRH